MTQRQLKFVLLHGSWLGGWCWRAVVNHLQSLGHSALAPSLPGMGEHASADLGNITLDTFIDSTVQWIEEADLTDIVLVGHSFSGVVITGVADRIADRIRCLVYLDAIIVKSGDTAFSVYPNAEAEKRIAAARASGLAAAPPPTRLPVEWGLNSEDGLTVSEQLRPHPIGTYTSRLALNHPIGNGRRCFYIRCTRPHLGLLGDMFARLVDTSNWVKIDLATAHLPMVTAPQQLAELLTQIGEC